MRLIYIARKNLFAKPLQTTLSTILLAFGVGMVSLMMLSEKQIKDQFERNIKENQRRIRCWKNVEQCTGSINNNAKFRSYIESNATKNPIMRSL